MGKSAPTFTALAGTDQRTEKKIDLDYRLFGFHFAAGSMAAKLAARF